MYIKAENVVKKFKNRENKEITALEELNLEINEGEFIALLGPSGCGKTTLLNMIAGFDFPTSGKVTINDETVKEPSKDNIAVFQNYGLLPWRTVQKNVEFGLEGKGIKRKERKIIAEKYIEMVGLTKFKKHHPHQLSGGMQQRTALARALAVEPKMLFMDEPFGALDAITRVQMQNELKEIWRRNKNTVIFVTHDIEEALFLATRVVIMSAHPGKIRSVIDISLPEERKRTSSEFITYRDRILSEFDLYEKGIDYYI